MGEFNHKANFSNLPCKYGDRIVVLIGVSPKKYSVDDFAPGSSFSPVSVPIRGYYDDYGGIENVDRTPGIDILESYFGIGVDEIVRSAERIQSGCSDQIDYDKIQDVCKKIYSQSSFIPQFYPNLEFELSYIIEHEEIFDYLVSVSSKSLADQYFWQIPHPFIERLGYTKKLLGKNNSYEIIEWTHPNSPKLKEECYVWLESKYKNFGETTHTITDLCKKIDCDIPEWFESSYLGWCFDNDMNSKNYDIDPDLKKVLTETLKGNGKNDKEIEDILNSLKNGGKVPLKTNPEYRNCYSFKRNNDGRRGLFYQHEGFFGRGELILASFGNTEDHLEVKYKKDIVELAAFLQSLGKLEITWGTTNYYRQEINYSQHIEFLEKCLKVAKDKKNK